MKNKGLSKPEVGPVKASPRPRTKFTDEFKRMAVARLRETDNATLLALELGIRRNQLYKWARMRHELEPGKTALYRIVVRGTAKSSRHLVDRRQANRARLHACETSSHAPNRSSPY